MSKYRADDIDLLVPSFAHVVRLVLRDMRALGHDPVPFDTLRTKEEAARNARRGRGIRRSVHMYGCAADIICGQHGWSCGANGHGVFWSDLGRIAESYGLTWGGRWQRRDMPHIQAIRVTEQPQLYALGFDVAALDAFVAPKLKARSKKPL